MYGRACPKVHPLPLFPSSPLPFSSLWERAEKDSNSFKMEKSFNAIPTLSKTPTYLSPVCGLWKDISGLGLRGENLPSEAGLGMSYRHLRGWKSLGSDHGFSIQLQPQPGSRAQAAPPTALVNRRNIGRHQKVALIWRIKRGQALVSWCLFVHTCSCKVQWGSDRTGLQSFDGFDGAINHSRNHLLFVFKGKYCSRVDNNLEKMKMICSCSLYMAFFVCSFCGKLIHRLIADEKILVARSGTG